MEAIGVERARKDSKTEYFIPKFLYRVRIRLQVHVAQTNLFRVGSPTLSYAERSQGRPRAGPMELEGQ